ncbi:MAG: SpoIID/LytB domain-containing protein [Pseudonocardiales bacterium]
MTARKTILTALLATLVLALSGAVLAGPASAAGRDGTCNSGEFCYYFNTDEAGSVSDFIGSLDDYGATQPTCYEFKGDGLGQGVCVKNNAAAVWNRTSKTVRVYFNSNFAGAFQDFASGAKGNLNATLKNNNASHELLSSAPPLGCKTDGTNSKLPSTILVYRVSLGRVDRVDFKTYVKNVLPNEWIASWRAESLKSGAMAVKSFGWYWALHSTRETSGGACFDVYDNTLSQVYQPGSAVASTNSAVEATWGTRMTRSGNILQAHYCATRTACPAWVDGNWMSQDGSEEMAVNGRGYATILHAYYDGIVLTS